MGTIFTGMVTAGAATETVASTLVVTVVTTVLCSTSINQLNAQLETRKETKEALTLASTTMVETAVSTTVTVDKVAVDMKQRQALLMRLWLDEHFETMASTESGEEVGSRPIAVMVGDRFRNTVETSLPVLIFRWFHKPTVLLDNE